MRVLLSGASGFVGSFLLKKLLENNIPVAILLRGKSNTWRIESCLESVEIINIDDSGKWCFDQIKAFSPDTLIQVSWYGVENNHCNDVQQLDVNLQLTQQLFDIAKKVNIKSYIGLGSQGEYGPHNDVLSEYAVPNPTTMYGVAKLAAYHYLRVACDLANLRFVWLRLFSSYGPHDNPNWFIQFLISELIQGKSPKLTMGTQNWDFIYIEDVATAIFQVANAQVNGVFNLGSGEVVRIKDLAIMIRDYINPSITLDFGAIPYRKDQVMHLQANISRLNTELGWKPKYSLSQGVKLTVDSIVKSHAGSLNLDDVVSRN